MSDFTGLKIINTNNSLKGDILRKNIIEILELINDCIKSSYGPYGSTTFLTSPNGELMQTKDGYTILNSVKLNGELSSIIYKECVAVSNHLSSTVGDATTSSIMLTYEIYKEIAELIDSGKYIPRDINSAFSEITNLICDKILANRQEFDIDKAYNIALTASNNNKVIADRIKKLIEEHGTALICEPKVSSNGKERDVVTEGNTIDYPLLYNEFINQPGGSSECVINNPNIYFYKDSIDNQIMIESIGTIIRNNILSRIENRDYPHATSVDYIPTVIIAPSFSKDFEKFIQSLLQTFSMTKVSDRPPLCIIESNHSFDELEDIKDLCGGLWICKSSSEKSNDAVDLTDINYLNSLVGRCKTLISNETRTIFKTPYMLNKNTGEEIDMTDTVIEKLKTEINVESKKDNPDFIKISNRKKRINKLSRKIAYLYIEVIGDSDSYNTLKVYEDVCTSLSNAYENGVGRAGLFELFSAVNNLTFEDQLHNDLLNVIRTSIKSLLTTLLSTGKVENIDEVLSKYDEVQLPYNIVSKEYDDTLLTSIMSDVEIIKAVESIVVKLALVNQVLLSKDLPQNY